MNDVKDFYNRYNYPLINTYTNIQRKRHLKLIKHILSFVNLDLSDLKDKRVLCAGCGTGDKAIFLSKYAKEVYCLDFSKGQLAMAKKRALKQNIHNICFVKKDILNDDLSDLGFFDLILSIGVLHHTENAKKGFQRLVKHLKPKARIIIALYHKYARIRYRFIRFLMNLFVSRDTDKKIYWLHNSIFAKPLLKAPKNSIYDRYVVPFESYHTLNEVKRWFKENNLNLIKHSLLYNIDIFNLFSKKTLFFVGGKNERK